ncbi:hypothetical protein CRUP_015427 [Coryphaenoides rupestris]|nr:hypothetical protein CRUP_015427 [Coryphaenoides rupestris]
MEKKKRQEEKTKRDATQKKCQSRLPRRSAPARPAITCTPPVPPCPSLPLPPPCQSRLPRRSAPARPAITCTPPVPPCPSLPLPPPVLLPAMASVPPLLARSRVPPPSAAAAAVPAVLSQPRYPPREVPPRFRHQELKQLLKRGQPLPAGSLGGHALPNSNSASSSSASGDAPNSAKRIPGEGST